MLSLIICSFSLRVVRRLEWLPLSLSLSSPPSLSFSPPPRLSLSVCLCMSVCIADFGLAKQKRADCSRMNSVVGTILCSWCVDVYLTTVTRCMLEIALYSGYSWYACLTLCYKAFISAKTSANLVSWHRTGLLTISNESKYRLTQSLRSLEAAVPPGSNTASIPPPFPFLSPRSTL